MYLVYKTCSIYISDDIATDYETLHVLRIALTILYVYAVHITVFTPVHNNVTYSRRIIFNFSRSVVCRYCPVPCGKGVRVFTCCTLMSLLKFTACNARDVIYYGVYTNIPCTLLDRDDTCTTM